MTKEQMILDLQRCARFKREKFGAWELLGVMCKACVKEYWDEYCAMDAKLREVWGKNNRLKTK